VRRGVDVYIRRVPIEYLQMVAVAVRDQERAKAFYVGTLGWDLLADQVYPIGGGRTARWLEVRPPRGQTAISLVVGDDQNRVGGHGLTLRALDLTQTVAELAASGVTLIHEIRETPLARYTSCEDPDGNRWTLQELKRSASS
jgi:predicted enzyme related to lactoylglutathione lyase